jgi:hypothetical protein
MEKTEDILASKEANLEETK